MLDLNCAAHRALLSRPVRAFFLVVLSVLSVQAAAPAALADESVVDDTSATVHLNGSWQRSTSVPGFYGTDYLVHTPGTRPASVHWPFPSSGAPGQYRVLVRYTSGPDRSSAATYHVDASDAATDVSVDQQVGGGTWHSLGTFTFTPGQDEEVSLSGAADGVVVANAVEWVGPLATQMSADMVAGPPSPAPVQSAVNSGDQPWRLDPLAVAHAESAALGLSAGDPMRLLELGNGHALVRTQDAGETYDIRLSQPDQPGPAGIWVVDSIYPTDPGS